MCSENKTLFVKNVCFPNDFVYYLSRRVDHETFFVDSTIFLRENVV